MLPKDSDFHFDRCANCGCHPVSIVNGLSLYDGEGVCSKECLAEHNEKGCPLEDNPMQYRICPH